MVENSENNGEINETIVKPEIGIRINGKSFNYKLFETLESLSRTYSQRKTAKELKISHSVLNRRIKNAEEQLGEKLVFTIGSGSFVVYSLIVGYNLFIRSIYSLQKSIRDSRFI